VAAAVVERRRHYIRHHLFHARQKPTLVIAFDFARCLAKRAGFLTARSTRFAVQAERSSLLVKLIK
jgi:hypothetical protein